LVKLIKTEFEKVNMHYKCSKCNLIISDILKVNRVAERQTGDEYTTIFFCDGCFEELGGKLTDEEEKMRRDMEEFGKR